MSIASTTWLATPARMLKSTARRRRNFRSRASIFPSASRRSATRANVDGLNLAGIAVVQAAESGNYGPLQPLTGNDPAKPAAATKPNA